MKSVLITGANKGIGFETARQLLQKGYYVYIGCRDIKKGIDAVEKLKAEGLHNVETLQIDVSNQDSVNAARIELGKKIKVLDVLVNNAGISGGDLTASTTSVDRFKHVYETNVFGVVRVTQTFMDLLKNATDPRIVNVSSGLGSLTLASTPSNIYYNYKGAIYQSSKAALNMYTIALAYELRNTAFKVNAVCPGFTKTDMNNHRGFGTVEDAGKRIVKYAIIDNDGPTGKYFCEELYPETGECPW